MLTTIIDHNTTKRKPRLKPADNYTIRLFPGLWSEIGLDPAILLAQLDYWTSTEATEHAGRHWLKISAASISRRLYNNWSIRTVQRLLQTLADEKLIQVEYFEAPTNRTPYILIDYELIAKKLETITVEENIRIIPDNLPLSGLSGSPCVTDDADLRHQCRRPASQVTQNNRSLYIRKDSKSQEDQIEERETATTANPDPNTLTKDDPFLTFAKTLAQICMTDFDCAQHKIIPIAKQMWKGGQGYTTADLQAARWWWDHHDYRGIKGSPPYLAQVPLFIAHALQSDQVQERAELIEAGLDPNNPYSRGIYLFGVDH